MSVSIKDNWTQFHQTKAQSNYPIWPIEVMVKSLFGNYLKKKICLNEDSKVLDIGCGFGNNLMPFLVSGYKCYGVEISDEICGITREILQNRGFSCEIKKGCNTHLPYSDNTFDLLLANGVIHYEKDEAGIHKALKEYTRVLKPKGSLFLMTTAPEHSIVKDAKVVGNHQYIIHNFDFRDGETLFFFDNVEDLRSYFSKYFKIVEFGRVTEELFTSIFDAFVVVAHHKR